MVNKQFMIKGKYVEMFEAIKAKYEADISRESGFELNISNNQLLEKIVEDCYHAFTSVSE